MRDRVINELDNALSNLSLLSKENNFDETILKKLSDQYVDDIVLYIKDHIEEMKVLSILKYDT